MGPQYTSCVEPSNFEPVNRTLVTVLVGLAAVGGVAAVLVNPGLALVSVALIVQALRITLDWMLNGKLVCLHRDHAATDCVCSGDTGVVCAIGRVVDTEAVGQDKNPVEDVDNDEAINLVLYPFNMSDFADDPPAGTTMAEANLAWATHPGAAQGDLLRRPDPPLKRKDGADLPYAAYFSTVIFSEVFGWKAWTEVIGRDYGWFGIIGPDQQMEWGKYQKLYRHENPKLALVPVLHCEFEGSRIRNVLAAIEAFSFGGGWCKKNWFTRALCTILQTVFAPLALLAALAAWATASDGEIGDALEGGGTVGPREDVIVRGRWTYDGGHQGYNEIHATRFVQKVQNIPADPALFDDFLKRWCARLSETPHADTPGVRPADASAAATYGAQQRPENGWVLHPAIDGCAPEDRPPPGDGLH